MSSFSLKGQIQCGAVLVNSLTIKPAGASGWCIRPLTFLLSEVRPTRFFTVAPVSNLSLGSNFTWGVHSPHLDDPPRPLVIQKLVDDTLDHPAGDTRTLRSCYRVAKSWISPSRRHLFSALLLDTDRILAWNKTFPSPENSPARHVRELTISFEQTTPIDFTDRMPYFSNVQQLSLSGLLTTDPSFTSKALGQLPPTIRSVTL